MTGATSRTRQAWLYSNHVAGGPWQAVLVADDTALASAPVSLWSAPAGDLYVTVALDQEGHADDRWSVAYTALLPEGQTQETELATGALRLNDPTIPLKPVNRAEFNAILTDWGSAVHGPQDDPEQNIGVRRNSAATDREAISRLAAEDEGEAARRSFWCCVFPWKCNPVQPPAEPYEDDGEEDDPPPRPRPFGPRLVN